MSEARLVLGVDSSTQSTKLEVREIESGRVVARASAAHPRTSPPRSEQDPEAWWVALAGALEGLGEQRERVVALAVAGQQHGMVVLDASGAPLRPAKLWNDTESAPDAAALVAAQGPGWWAQACGSVPVASFTVSKVAWLARCEPGLLARVDRVMLPHDFLTYRLTGAFVTDRGDASGTGWWSDGGYCDEILKLVGLSTGQLPRVLGPREPAGTLRSDAAERLGLREGTLVGAGTGDNMAAALGLGLRPGDLALSLGTSGTVYAVSTRATHDARGEVAGFADANGGFLPLVCTLNATKVTDSVARWLGTDAAGLSELALRADPSRAPELVPYFDGERTPNRPDARGVLSGLTHEVGREEIALAAHDGVLRGLLFGVESLRREGVAVSGRLHLIGGGGRSAAYRQRLADLHGEPILVPELAEAVAAGAALQAAAVHGDEDFCEIAVRWGLRRGIEVSPR